MPKNPAFWFAEYKRALLLAYWRGVYERGGYC